MAHATKDIHGNLHALPGTVGGGGKFVEKLKNETPQIPARKVTALDNPILAKLRGDAAAAKLDSDKAIADAIKQFVRDTYPEASKVTLFSDMEEGDGYAFEAVGDADGNELDSAGLRGAIELAICDIGGDNLRLLGTSDWVEDDNDDGRRGYRLTIDLADEPHLSAVDLHLKAVTDGYGPLCDAITTAIDRGNIPDEAILGLDDADIEDLYDRHMGRAIDKIEHDLLDPVFLAGE